MEGKGKNGGGFQNEIVKLLTKSKLFDSEIILACYRTKVPPTFDC